LAEQAFVHHTPNTRSGMKLKNIAVGRFTWRSSFRPLYRFWFAVVAKLVDATDLGPVGQP